MAKTIPLFDELEELALKLRLPKHGDYYDWFALPCDVFYSWFKWVDKEEAKKIYLTFEPPTDKLHAYYDYSYSLYYRLTPGLKSLPANVNLNIINDVFCCTLGLFTGSNYSSNKITSPKKGIFINLVDLKRFEKAPHKALIKSGETIFCIDYLNS